MFVFHKIKNNNNKLSENQIRIISIENLYIDKKK